MSGLNPLPESIYCLAPQTLANKKPDSLLTQGQVVVQGRYRLLERLGVGAHGEVWRAFMQGVERTVVIKFMRHKESDKAKVERFIAEARILAGLNHPNVIRIYEVNSFLDSEGKKIWYLVMEDVRAISLEERLQNYLKNRTPDSKKKMIELIIKVLKTLKYVHEQGVLHRDLKPANILVTERDEPILIDFGSAQSVGSGNRNASSVIEFSPYFMAPETLFHPDSVSEKTDYYSIGAILYLLFLGRLPYKYTQSFNALLQELQHEVSIFSSDYGDIELVRQLPANEKSILRSAMAFNVGQRYESADLFVKDLEKYLGLSHSSTRYFLKILGKGTLWGREEPGEDREKLKQEFERAVEQYKKETERDREKALRNLVIGLDALEKKGLEDLEVLVIFGNAYRKLAVLKWMKKEFESAKVDFQRSESIYRRVIQAYPNNHEGFLGLAELYSQTDLDYNYYKDFLNGRIRFVRFGEAEGLYSRVIQQDPENEKAYFDRAALKYECIKNGVLDRSNYSLVQQDLETCLKLKPIASSKKITDRKVILRTVFFLAKAYFRDRDYNYSAKWLKKGLADLELVMASIKRKINSPQYRKEVGYWRKVLREYEGLKISYDYLLVDSLWLAGEKKRASAHFHKTPGLEINKTKMTSKEVLIDQIRTFLNWPNYEEAEEILTEALAIHPQSQTFHLWRIQAKLNQVLTMPSRNGSTNAFLKELEKVFIYYNAYQNANIRTKSYSLLKALIEREIFLVIKEIGKKNEQAFFQSSRIFKRHMKQDFFQAASRSKREFERKVGDRGSYAYAQEITFYFDVPWSFFKKRTELQHLFLIQSSQNRAPHPRSSQYQKTTLNSSL